MCIHPRDIELCASDGYREWITSFYKTSFVVELVLLEKKIPLFKNYNFIKKIKVE